MPSTASLVAWQQLPLVDAARPGERVIHIGPRHGVAGGVDGSAGSMDRANMDD